jgi:hypothetical protein
MFSNLHLSNSGVGIDAWLESQQNSGRNEADIVIRRLNDGFRKTSTLIFIALVSAGH